jgi:hypothetical protein
MWADFQNLRGTVNRASFPGLRWRGKTCSTLQFFGPGLIPGLGWRCPKQRGSDSPLIAHGPGHGRAHDARQVPAGGVERR